MRRMLGFGLLTGLFLMAGAASADLIVGGHYLPPGRSLVGEHREPVVLVHIYNPDKLPIKAGELKIGLDVAPTGGKSRTLEVKCPKDLIAAGIVTCPIPLPKDVKAMGSDGWYRVYVTHAGARVQSPRYSVAKPSGAEPARKITVTDLYTEAPALSDDPRLVVPPPDIPFENEVPSTHPAVAPKSAMSAATRPGTLTRPVAAATHVAAKTTPTVKTPAVNTGATHAGDTNTTRPAIKVGHDTANVVPPTVGKDSKSAKDGVVIRSGKDAKNIKAAKAAKKDGPSAAYESAPPLLESSAVPVTAHAAVSAKAEAVQAKAADVKAEPKKPDSKKTDDKKSDDKKSDGKKTDGKKGEAPEFKTIRTIDEELVITVVRPGDTLKSIAEKYYKSGAKEKAIAEYNFIDNPNSIRVGEEIIVEVKPLKGEAKALVGDKDGADSGKKAKKGKKSAGQEAAATDAKADKKSSDKGDKKHGKKSDVQVAQTASSVEAPPLTANAGTVATADSAHPAATEPRKDLEYTVLKGDTPAIIAKKFYGKYTKANRILNANPQLDPKKLMPGMTIVVPGAGAQG